MSYADHRALPAMDEHQPAPWSHVEEVFGVLRGLTNPAPSSDALEDWIATFTSRFELRWNDIDPAARQSILVKLGALPAEIARNRKRNPRPKPKPTKEGDYVYQAPVILESDLPSIDEFDAIIRDTRPVVQSHGWIYHSTNVASAFRPVARASIKISRDDLDRKLKETVDLFPSQPRKYDFRKGAQDWVNEFKKVDTYQRWDSLSSQQQGEVMKELKNVSKTIRENRITKTSLKAENILPKMESFPLGTMRTLAPLPPSSESAVPTTGAYDFAGVNTHHSRHQTQAPRAQLPLDYPRLPPPHPFSQGYHPHQEYSDATPSHSYLPNPFTLPRPPSPSDYRRPEAQEMIPSGNQRYYGPAHQHYITPRYK